MSGQTLFELAIYVLALWLGLYLINRDVRQPRLLLAGLGLVFYAVALAATILLPLVPKETFDFLLAVQRPFLFLPALCWLLLLLLLWRGDEEPLPERLKRAKRPFILILVASIFFALGLTTIVLTIDILPRAIVFLGIGGDLLLLGIGIAMLDASDDGETIWPDFIRSFIYTLTVVLLFGGQIVLLMAFSTGITFPLFMLLLTTVTVAVILQTTSGGFQTLLDKIAFAPSPQIRQERNQLRSAYDAAQRVDTATDLLQLDDTEFTRLTRRALSHMGNLPKLAANPLTRLPLVDNRLQQRNIQDNTLERAAELKTILTESIERLKPTRNGDFDSSDAWRHFNALYYPYVLGLKPYSRRADFSQLPPAEQDALDWFRTQVPERTLYNWQNAAAALIAQYIREQSP